MSKKRKDKPEAQDELREQLNSQQCMTLDGLFLLGWSLRFANRPGFEGQVPVVVSDDDCEIGLLDTEGKIVIDRTSKSIDEEESPEAALTEAADVWLETAETDLSEPAAEVIVSSSWVEKRRGEEPIPDNLEDYLNQHQINALRQIENFGWELKFVRRPLFQEPIAVIMNTDGDRIGTLESDGRIDLKENFDLREDTESGSGEKAVSEP